MFRHSGKGSLPGRRGWMLFSFLRLVSRRAAGIRLLIDMPLNIVDERLIRHRDFSAFAQCPVDCRMGMSLHPHFNNDGLQRQKLDNGLPWVQFLSCGGHIEIQFRTMLRMAVPRYAFAKPAHDVDAHGIAQCPVPETIRSWTTTPRDVRPAVGEALQAFRFQRRDPSDAM